MASGGWRAAGGEKAETAPTLAQALALAAGTLRDAGIDAPALEARVLLAHVLGITPERLVMELGEAATLESRVEAAFERIVQRRAAGEPMAYITGTKEFWSLDFWVTPATLIPRPDSETLIQAVIDCFPDRARPYRMLDLGVGSGCLIVAALREYPSATGVGIDRDAQALRVAARNAASHSVSGRVQFVQSHWGAALAGRFDVILCNPPYIAPEERSLLEKTVVDFEPHGALFAPSSGLAAYEELAADLGRLLKAEGKALIEIGQGQSAAVSALFARSGLRVLAVIPDLAGIPRCMMVDSPQP